MPEILRPGTKVRTTEENPKMIEEMTIEVLEKRKWGVKGSILLHHDSHGLCYEIQHEDRTIGDYDPTEFEVL